MIADIASDDALILPHSANPTGSNFRERHALHNGPWSNFAPPLPLALPKGLLNRRRPFLADGSFEFEKMVAPRVELDEESCRAELIPVTDVAFPVQRFHQAPDAAAQVVPRKLHHRLRTVIGEVHHHQSPYDPQPPTPGNNVVKGRIVGPAVALAQMPFAVVEKIGMGRAQQAAVKRNEGVIARLQRAAGQEHRKLDFTALDLPVIDELRTGRRPDNYGRGVLLGRREGGGGARLVVILDEADEPVLIVEPRR